MESKKATDSLENTVSGLEVDLSVMSGNAGMRT